MKFMLIMRSTEAAVAAAAELDFEEIINQMGAYNEAMINAGVLLAGDGLAPNDPNEFVVDFATDPPTVTDGPYGETHELFNGFWIIQTDTREEAIEWARRCPLGPGSKLEVRRVTDMSDFEGYADNEYLRKEEAWRDQLGTA